MARSGSQATYQLGVEEGLPEGTTATLDAVSVTLDPGESRQVQFTLSVDNTTTPNAPDEPFSYDGAIVAQTDGLELRVPFSFIKSPVINFTFDEEPWILWLHDENGEGYFKPYPGKSLILPIGGTGDFNAVVTFNDVATRVFVEDIQVETVAYVTVAKADAIHSVNIEPVDQNGDRKFPNIGGESLTHKASNASIGFIFGFPTQRRFSDFSDAYSWEWVVTESTVSKDPVYDFNGYIHQGLTGDRTFTNRPTDLKHMLFRYDAPSGVDGLVVQHWLSDGPRGGTSFTVFNTLGQNALTAPFARDVYFMPIPDDDFAFGYFYEDVVPSGAISGPGLGQAVARTPYLAAQNPTEVSGFLQGETEEPVLRTDSSRMDLGLPPPHWFGRFENSDTEIRLKAARGRPMWLFLNPLKDFVPHPNLPYELYLDGALIASGDLQGAGEFPSFTTPSSIPIPAVPGPYSMVVVNDLYRVDGQPGTATVTASFDTTKTDRDPPTLLSLAVLSSGEEPTRRLAPTANGRVALSFDDVMASVPVVEFGTGDTGGQPVWRTVQATDLGSGDYVAHLPILPNDSYISLRLTALDAAGNSLEYKMVPAFKVALEAPALISPLDGYNTRGPEVSLSWGDVDTAAEYLVQVDGNSTFDSPALYEATVAGTVHLVPVQNGIHHWRARTRDSMLNESPWSVVRTFTVADPVVPVTDDPARDNTPAVVQGSGGRISAVWSSCPAGCSIWHGSSDDGGSAWSAGTMVSSDQYNDYEPDIMSRADGALWVVWHSSRNTGPGGVWNSDIFYSTSSDGGSTWSPAERLTTQTSEDEAPAIAQTPGGRLVVVWHSNRSGGRDLWYKTSDDGGGTWSAAMQLTANASADFDADVVALDDGELWVAWNRNARIYYVTGDDGGVSWSSERQLTTCCTYRPSLAETADGKLWAAWHSATDTNAAHVWNDELFYMTTEDGGASWSFETKYTRFLGADRNVGVAAVGSGDSLALVWDSARKGDSDVWFGIVGRFEDVNAPPAVLSVTHLPFPNPDSDDEVTITAQVASETPVADVDLVWSVDGLGTGDLRMFDDGINGDGLAGDGTYGVRIGPLQSGTVVDYQARVADGGGNIVLSPRTANSFQTLDPVAVTSEILLVVDKRFVPTETTYYTTALEDLGLPFDLWETHLRGPVDDAILGGYLGGAVVWAMPDYGYLGEVRARDSLESYLDGGGALFITGQNLGEFLGFTGLYQEYLYADHVQGDTDIFTLTGVPGDPVGGGLGLDIQGFGGANNQYSPSEIAPIPPALPVLTYDDPATPGRAAAIRVDTGTYRLVHFAFGFAAINTREDRAGVMGRVIGWLIQGSIAGTVDLQNRDDDAGATVTVVGTGITAQTDSDGRYLIQGIPPGEFDIEVTMPTYLTARKMGVIADQGLVTDLPPVFLRGGDLNMDGRVDGLDLAAVGLNLGYSKSDW